MIDHAEPMRLPACPSPLPGEGLLGYLMRLTKINGYRSLRRVFGLAGYRTMPRNMPHFDYPPLAELTRQPVELLYGLSYPFVGSGMRILLNQKVPSFFVEQNRPRICLACLQADFMIKAVWDLPLMVCCPEHGSYLLADCPECKQPLEWGRPDWDRCRCGCIFTEYSSQPAPKDIQAYCRYLDERFSPDVSEAELKTLSNIAGPISIGSCLTLTALLGQWSVNECHAPPDKMFQGKSMPERGAYILAAMKILKGWPGAFYELLDRVKGKGSYPDISIRINRDFGKPACNFMNELSSPDLDFVREALKGYNVRGFKKNPPRRGVLKDKAGGSQRCVRFQP